MIRHVFHLWLAAAPAAGALGDPAAFVRGINSNGPALMIDGHGLKAGARAKNLMISTLRGNLVHLPGFDHTRHTYRNGGRDYTLTGVFGKVIGEQLALVLCA